jgi:hypothetical protein
LLHQTAGTRLNAQDALIVVVGEAKDIRKGLEALGPVTVYDTDLKAAPETVKEP